MHQAILKHALEMGVGLPWRWGWDQSHAKHTAATVERGDWRLLRLSPHLLWGGRMKRAKPDKILLTESSN